MNRRNVILGLGGLVAGGGVLVGTGAFDTVEAERTVSVETAGDADAFLALEPAERDVAEGEPDNAFVEETDGTIEITFGDEDGATGGGLNLNARTVFEELVVIQNQGTQDGVALGLAFTDDSDDAIADAVGFRLDGPDGDLEGEPGETFDPEDTQSVAALDPGEEATLGFEFDLIDETVDIDEFDLTLEITAEAGLGDADPL